MIPDFNDGGGRAGLGSGPQGNLKAHLPIPHTRRAKEKVFLHREAVVGQPLADLSQDSPELLKRTEMTQPWLCCKNE